MADKEKLDEEIVQETENANEAENVNEPEDTVNQDESSKTETQQEETADTSEKTDKESQEETDAADESSEEKKDKKDLIIEELTDKYKRTFAEFDNYRKRTEKEKSAMFEVGAKSIIEKILPIVDSFERGLSTIPEDEKGTPFAEGMDKVYKQLVTALEEAGVKPIESLNAQFDPNFHNAVMHVEDENVGENVVIEEFQKGYTYRDSVVRHSMVKVAN